jgi:hypothetical protein
MSTDEKPWHEKQQEERRRKVTEAVTPNLKKPIPELLIDIHEMSQQPMTQETQYVTRTVARFATLLSVLSIQADIQTRRIVRLTWALLILTGVLAVLTVYLVQDAYFKRDHQSYNGQQKQPVAYNCFRLANNQV